jgi:hypothetical protein
MTILILLAAFFYFVPAIAAFTRQKRNAGAITVLNIFAGWTFIGWIVALVWAVSEDA